MQRAHYTLQSTISRDFTSVLIPVDDVILAGDLCVPKNAKGIVVFAHGSGSSRFSPRNRYVADVLNEYEVGTLLIDLLTPEEERVDEQTRELRFDIPLLAQRLETIGGWILEQLGQNRMKLGYFGASTGGAAALIAAAAQPDVVEAVVCRGGRPDLASEILPEVQAPCLLIVGERDQQVLEWNKRSLALLNKRSKIEVIPGATHLFEEAGALEAVSQLAAEWFCKHFSNRGLFHL